MKLSSWLLFALMSQFGCGAYAEGGCPAGMLPASGTNINSCVPIPVGYYQEQQTQTQAPPPQWARRWGAIATDGVSGSLGTATGMKSREEATQVAMSDCQAKGGLKCKLDVAYDNECAAMVVGSKGYSVNADVTLEAATRLATKICSEDGDKNCQVYYSACSMPVKIR